MRHALLLAVMAAGSLTPAKTLSSQATCPDTATIRTCLNRARIEEAQRVTAVAAQDAKAKTAGKPAGEANAAQLTPTIDDFLSRLAAAAVAPGLDTGLVVRLTTNFSLDTEHFRYLPVTMRLGAELRRPEVYAPMLDSVAEAQRSAVRERFRKELGELDDVELTAAFNLESRALGRRYEPHSREFDLVRQEFGATLTAARAIAALNGFLGGVLPKKGQAGCDAADVYDAKVSCLSSAERDSAVTLATVAGNAVGAFEKAYEGWRESSGWKYVPDLLNNQPQLSLHAGWRPRSHAVGPETFSVRLRYERGYINLNSVRSFCARESREGDPGIDAGRFTAACFRNYTQNHVNRGLLRMGVRGFLEAELKNERHYDAPFLVADSAHFSLPKAWRLSVNGGIGGFLPGSGETQGSRIDLGFTGERVLSSEDNAVQPDRRLSVSLSLTQRLNQNFSLLSGLVWSDRGEFADDDVQKVRLRLGIRYKLVPTAPAR